MRDVIGENTNTTGYVIAIYTVATTQSLPSLSFNIWLWSKDYRGWVVRSATGFQIGYGELILVATRLDKSSLFKYCCGA